MATILIVKAPADSRFSVIDALAERWVGAGHGVTTRYAHRNLPEADIVVAHVDTTCLPREYAEAFERYPTVVNGRAVDIDRSRFSRLMLAESDDYDGPVIVKTRGNFGGEGDERYRVGKYLRHRLLVRWHHRLSRKRERDWQHRRTLAPHEYPIFARKAEVPGAVWRNPHLMVERFRPETDAGLYFVRYWIFFGDEGWARRFGSRNPIVKFGNRATEEETVSVPAELVALRARLGLDYGRIDYVQHGSTVAVLDANKTLGYGRNIRGYEADIDRLARGIAGFIEGRSSCNDP
jgi:hypothetical protein